MALRSLECAGTGRMQRSLETSRRSVRVWAMSAEGRAVSGSGHEIMSGGRHPTSASGHACERVSPPPDQLAFVVEKEPKCEEPLPEGHAAATAREIPPPLTHSRLRSALHEPLAHTGTVSVELQR